MSTKSRSSRIALSLAFATIAVAAAAAPVAVKSFDKTTWKQMAASLPKPSVVVFTTTDCAFCPDVIDALARDV
ncbi:MAG: hypothetical protein ABL931_11710, partial [Usitatibacteraceae bacterium]